MYILVFGDSEFVHFPAFCYFVAHKFVHARAAMCDDLYPLQPTNSTFVGLIAALLYVPLSLSLSVFFFLFRDRSLSFSWQFSLFVEVVYVVVFVCACIFIHSFFLFFSDVYLIFPK